MPVSEDYLAFVIGQFSDWAPITARKMFGGAGLFRDGLMFGLLASDTAYLKADDENRPDFEKAGMGPFRPFEGKKRPMTMPYYEIPADVLEDPARLAAWADQAYAAAIRTRKPDRRGGGCP